MNVGHADRGRYVPPYHTLAPGILRPSPVRGGDVLRTSSSASNRSPCSPPKEFVSMAALDENCPLLCVVYLRTTPRGSHYGSLSSTTDYVYNKKICRLGLAKCRAERCIYRQGCRTSEAQTNGHLPPFSLLQQYLKQRRVLHAVSQRASH